MTRTNQLRSFKKMWTWLSGYPAHDRKYYMTHVDNTAQNWMNNCPLANSELVSNCDGCKMLWSTSKGSLCTDPDAPLYKWRATAVQQPDYRSYYASQVAFLASKALGKPEDKESHGEIITSHTV